MRTQKQTAAGPRVGLILLAALIGVPLIEIALFIQVGGWIGLAPTLALVVLTAVIGAWMLRRQGISVLIRAQRQLSDGSLPVVEVFEAVCLVVAGALLLTPGFFTDTIGALLLVPALRRTLYQQLRGRIEPHVFQGPNEGFGGAADGPPSGQSPGPTIEAEFEEIEEPDDRPTMPPPRGDWRRRE
jgi:UPF0716 protein FxsA